MTPLWQPITTLTIRASQLTGFERTADIVVGACGPGSVAPSATTERQDASLERGVLVFSCLHKSFAFPAGHALLLLVGCRRTLNGTCAFCVFATKYDGTSYVCDL